MKLTERNIKQYFPRDRRFLHFCAKYYGLSFYNDDVVETANFKAIQNVMELIKKDIEFDDEAHLTAYVMNSFRFAILSAYAFHDQKRWSLDVRNESELTYGDNEDATSLYEASAVSFDPEYSNTIKEVKEFLKTAVTEFDATCFIRTVIDGDTPLEVATDLKTSSERVIGGRRRALTQVKRFINKENAQTKKIIYQSPNSNGIGKHVRESLRDKSIRENEEKTYRYNKAMSFLYT